MCPVVAVHPVVKTNGPARWRQSKTDLVSWREKIKVGIVMGQFSTLMIRNQSASPVLSCDTVCLLTNTPRRLDFLWGYIVMVSLFIFFQCNRTYLPALQERRIFPYLIVSGRSQLVSESWARGRAAGKVTDSHSTLALGDRCGAASVTSRQLKVP